MALTESNTGAANILGNIARTAYELAFETSPIILNGGLFGAGMMPLGVVGLVGDLAGMAAGNSSLSDYFPDQKFVVMPGATAISYDVAMYPFANREVAANAVIRKPKTVSLMFISPVNSTGGYMLKTALFTLMQTVLEAHITAGGTFHIITPSMIYMDCLLTNVSDITGGEGRQQQIQWQFDFIQPLVSQAGADTAQNVMMNAISGGQQITTESWSGMAALSGLDAGNSLSMAAAGIQPLTSAM